MRIFLRRFIPENLEATISEGTITSIGDGKFIARVSKVGRVTITVFNKKEKNKAGTTMSLK